jgi:hypothetical protein
MRQHHLLPTVGKPYEMRISVPCSLSQVGMEEMALYLGPSFVYELTVHPAMELEAVNVLKNYGAATVGNPMAPYVNLKTDLTLEPREWMMEANGRCAGTTGC